MRKLYIEYALCHSVRVMPDSLQLHDSMVVICDIQEKTDLFHLPGLAFTPSPTRHGHRIFSPCGIVWYLLVLQKGCASFKDFKGGLRIGPR